MGKKGRTLTDRSHARTVVLGLVAACGLFLVGCLGTECTNEPITEVVSPDGSRKIILFSRDCGATTSFNVQGSILNRDEPLPDEGGSAFIIDQGSARVSWTGNSTLRVTFEKGVRVFKKEASDRGVSLEYQSE